MARAFRRPRPRKARLSDDREDATPGGIWQAPAALVFLSSVTPSLSFNCREVNNCSRLLAGSYKCLIVSQYEKWREHRSVVDSAGSATALQCRETHIQRRRSG